MSRRSATMAEMGALRYAVEAAGEAVATFVDAGRADSARLALSRADGPHERVGRHRS